MKLVILCLLLSTLGTMGSATAASDAQHDIYPDI
jgi:hypothetical protein